MGPPLPGGIGTTNVDVCSPPPRERTADPSNRTKPEHWGRIGPLKHTGDCAAIDDVNTHAAMVAKKTWPGLIRFDGVWVSTARRTQHNVIPVDFPDRCHFFAGSRHCS